MCRVALETLKLLREEFKSFFGKDLKGRVSQKLFLDMTHGVEQSVGIVKKLVA